MAIYHLSATAVQRSKGHSAVAGAAYRSGTVLRDAMTGQTHDYQRKRGIVQSEIIAPENAPDWTHDREALWNHAELAEKRRDAQPAREIRVALPSELSDGQRADLVFHYAHDMFAGSGMVADISIHRPDRHGDQRNHHAHILLTMRELDGDTFSTKKNRDWNKTETLEYWREQWADYQNDALEAAGYDARVDHRSFEEQGIDREPTRHLGKDASSIEREGKSSRIGDENREIERHNRQLDRLASELAAVDAEISAELAREYSEPEPDIRSQEPDTTHHPEIDFSFPTAQEDVALSREELTVGEEAPPVQPEAWALAIERQYGEPEQSASYAEIVQNYATQPPGEAQEAERERRWYEEFYEKAAETVQHYWSRFVNLIAFQRERDRERDREDYEPER